MNTVLSRLTRISSRYFSAPVRCSGETSVLPTQCANKLGAAPSRDRQASIAAAALSGVVTSNASCSSAATAASDAAWRPTAATRCPAPRSRATTSAPMPPRAPVTIATRLVESFIKSLSIPAGRPAVGLAKHWRVPHGRRAYGDHIRLQHGRRRLVVARRAFAAAVRAELHFVPASGPPLAPGHQAATGRARLARQRRLVALECRDHVAQGGFSPSWPRRCTSPWR